MNGEAWRRGYAEGRKFTAPRTNDNFPKWDAGAERRSAPFVRLVTALFGIGTILGIYAGAVFLIAYSLGSDLSLSRAFIIAACGMTIRYMDAAINRNSRQS